MNQLAPPEPSCAAACEIELPRAADAAARARRFMHAQVGGHLSADALSDAQMVVSELVNNAFVHGAGRIVLKTRLSGDSLKIEVVDDGTGKAPAIREQGSDDGGGWGLRIVDTLSLDWGAYEGTTHVWAVISTA